jgi:hypothetical protein
MLNLLRDKPKPTYADCGTNGRPKLPAFLIEAQAEMERRWQEQSQAVDQWLNGRCDSWEVEAASELAEQASEAYYAAYDRYCELCELREALGKLNDDDAEAVELRYRLVNEFDGEM